MTSTYNGVTIPAYADSADAVVMAQNLVDGMIAKDAAKVDLAMTANTQTASYQFVLADATKRVDMNVGSANTLTVPAEATVAWPAGTTLRVLNIGAGVCTITPAGSVTINKAASATLALKQYEGGMLTKTGTNTWVFTPFVSGSAFAAVGSTTGSPATGTFTGTDGVLYNYWKWTANGSVTFSATGKIRLLIVGGAGGSGGDSSGGAGGYVALDLDVSAIEYPIVVGSAGASYSSGPYSAAGANGNRSYFGSLFALGGGGGADSVYQPYNGGASGGGASRNSPSTTYGRADLTYGRQGYDGGGPARGGLSAGQGGGGGAAGPGWPRDDGKTHSMEGGPGIKWINNTWYSAAGNFSNTAETTAGQTPNGQAAAANTGCSAGQYNLASAAGVVIVAIPA